MGAPYPSVLPEAFAVDADGAHRNVIPTNPVTTQRASFSLGFPPLVMTPVVAGGKPMLGPDMNGILYMLSSHDFYQQSGQPYRWNADVVTAIAGYAAGTILGSTDGLTLWFNLTANNGADPDAGGAGWVPTYSYGVTPIATNGGVVNLTAAQAAKNVIVITGVLVANLQVNFPTSLRRWLVVNSTSGAFTTTVKTPAGAGVNVPQGGFGAPTEVYGDGTNLYNVVAPITLPTDVAPTANTIALRSNNGYLYATYLNQNSPLENFTINEVFAGTGDGFIRKINRPNFAANFLLSQFVGQVTDAQVPVTAVNQHRAAILDNSNLTGTPTAPTPPVGDASTRIATTLFAYGSVSFSTNGLTRLANGLYFQWGTVAYGGGSVNPLGFVNFPIPFPTACLGVTGNANNLVSGGNLGAVGSVVIVSFDSYAPASARFRLDSNRNEIFGGGTFHWQAVGY